MILNQLVRIAGSQSICPAALLRINHTCRLFPVPLEVALQLISTAELVQVAMGDCIDCRLSDLRSHRDVVGHSVGPIQSLSGLDTWSKFPLNDL